MVREQYEGTWKDYYAILSVHRRAEPEVIRAAYTALAKKYHPDVGGANGKMRDINEAYEVLSDSGRRARYDAAYSHKQAKARTSDAPRQGPRSDHNPAGAQRPRAAETPVTRQRILPWPSWGWQRAMLLFSFPLGLFLLAAVDHELALVIGLVILASASYACIKTRWLSSTLRPNTLVKMCGFCAIAPSIGGIGFLIAGITALLVIPCLVLLLILLPFLAKSSS